MDVLAALLEERRRLRAELEILEKIVAALSPNTEPVPEKGKRVSNPEPRKPTLVLGPPKVRRKTSNAAFRELARAIADAFRLNRWRDVPTSTVADYLRKNRPPSLRRKKLPRRIFNNRVYMALRDMRSRGEVSSRVVDGVMLWTLDRIDL